MGAGQAKRNCLSLPSGSRPTDLGAGAGRTKDGEVLALGEWPLALPVPKVRGGRTPEVWAYPFSFQLCPCPGAAAQPLSATETPRSLVQTGLCSSVTSGLSSAPEPGFCAKRGTQGCSPGRPPGFRECGQDGPVPC